MTTSNPSPLDLPLSPIEWREIIELGYSDTHPEREVPNVCFGCGATKDKLLKCSKCNVATYCSKECQVADWKQGGHKLSCSSYSRVGVSMIISSEEQKKEARNEIFGRVRFYACSYAVFKCSTLGRGFLFIQSDNTLATMSLTKPKDSRGHPTPARSLLIHFLTMAEYDMEVCRDDFELASVRSALQTAVEQYEEETEVVVLMRFRCGHVALGISPLVPDYRVCKKLGTDYFSQNDAGALQLNLDDM